RRSDSGDTSTRKRRPCFAVTVRHTPSTAMLSPSVSRGSARGVSSVRCAPARPRSTRVTRPTTSMMPVNRLLPRPEDESAEPRVLVALGDRLELALVEPEPAALRALLDHHAVVVDGGERRPVLRTALACGLFQRRRPLLLQLLEHRLVA